MLEYRSWVMEVVLAVPSGMVDEERSRGSLIICCAIKYRVVVVCSCGVFIFLEVGSRFDDTASEDFTLLATLSQPGFHLSRLVHPPLSCCGHHLTQ